MASPQPPTGSFSVPPPGAIMEPPPGSFAAPPPGAVFEQPSDTQTTAPTLTWGTRLASLLGDPTAQQQVLDTSTAAVRNSPAGGVAMGMADPYYGVRQLTTHTLASALPNSTTQSWANSADQAAQAREQDYEQNWRQGQPQNGIDWGRTVGNILGMQPIAGALPVASGVVRNAAMGAGVGAGSGALTPVTGANVGDNYWGTVGSNAAAGAATGGIAGGIAGQAGRFINPNISPEVQTLRSQGVALTPGQIVGGMTGHIENLASGLPGIGSPIKDAKAAIVGEFNRGAISQALAPIGETLQAGGAGREAIAEMQDKIGKAYDAASSGLGIQDHSPAAMQLATGLRTIYQNSTNMLPARAQQFQTILKNQVFDRLSQGGGMSPVDFQAAKSSLGQMGSNFLHSSSADERDLGQTLLQTQNVLKGALVTSNPQAAQQLFNADAAYAMSRRVQGASATGNSGGEPGVFSPAGLQGTIRTQDQTVGKRAFAAGDALMQPYADAARSVIGPGVPQPSSPLGHVGGLAVNLLALRELAESLPFLSPEHALAAGAGLYGAARGLYSPTGRKIMGGLLASRPAIAGPIANGLLSTVPRAAVAAPQVYNGLLAGGAATPNIQY